MLIGFKTSKDAGNCVTAIIGSGMIPAALEFMDKRAIHICENYVKVGYPLDVEALLIVEVEGSEEEINLQFEHVRKIAEKFDPKTIRVSLRMTRKPTRYGKAANRLSGPWANCPIIIAWTGLFPFPASLMFWAGWPISPAITILKWPMCFMLEMAICIR